MAHVEKIIQVVVYSNLHLPVDVVTSELIGKDCYHNRHIHDYWVWTALAPGETRIIFCNSMQSVTACTAADG